MKRIFISHPLTSEGTIADNMKKVDAICKEVAAGGDLPVSPLHLFSFIEQETPEQREGIMRMCYHMIEGCDELYSYGKIGGCRQEAHFARWWGVPVVNKCL